MVSSWFAGLLSAFMVVFVNIFAAAISNREKQFYWYLGLGIVALWYVFNVFSAFYRIPVKIMQLYKFDNIHVTELVLKKNACNSLGALDVETAWYRDDICKLNDVLILSRLGKDAYLQYEKQGKK